jgi:uncharacterized protein YeaO (DUF488 family)
MPRLAVKRVYEPATKRDGLRILVDRIWPRGVAKQRARIDLWLGSVAPSTGLRRWFAHDPAKWGEFKRRYFEELDRSPPGLDELIKNASSRVVSLVYSARDERHNQAVALRDYLCRRLDHPIPRAPAWRRT